MTATRLAWAATLLVFLIGSMTVAGPGADRAHAQALNNDDLWARATAPLDASPWGPAPQVFGGYSNGCITNAVALPLDGPGFTVIRPQRNRYWGHPRLIAFVQQMGQFAATLGPDLLMVADLAQPRGGPISGHVSHEVGLDADIWLRFAPPGGLADAERTAPQELSVLTADETAIDPTRWTAAHEALYRFAATHPDTTRIFAHPLIKLHLCRTVTGDRSWLGRVVPWYGHNAHMHIRLRCPADSPFCVNQAPVGAGDGCGGALAWWLSDAPYQSTGGPVTPPPLPALPPQCAALAPD